MVVDIAAYLQERIKALDLSQEMKHLRRLRLLGKPDIETPSEKAPKIEVPDDINAKNLFNAMYAVELVDIQVSWIMSVNPSSTQGRNPEDLVFSIKRIDLATRGKTQLDSASKICSSKWPQTPVINVNVP